jgi:hypothetical protein
MDLNSNHSQTPLGAFLKPVFLFEWSQLKQLPHSILIINLLMFFIIGCEKQSQPTSKKANQGTLERFIDVTIKTKIAFTHQTSDPKDYFMPLDMGSGLALMDYNLDGLLDIYLLQNAGPGSNIKNQLFKQNEDGTFDNVSDHSGLDVDGYNMGVAIGDISNDGYPDVLLTGFQSTRLFLNQGGQNFTEITKAANIDNPGWGTSASFLDFDRDGWLDIVIANYIEYTPGVECTGKDGKREFCGPDGFPSATSKLYRNTGKDNLFEDVSVTSGIARHPGPGLGVVCLDFNGDHWPDIFIADDAKPNRLFINQQNGTFEEEGLKRGLALDAMGQTKANMGVAVGDMDNNGMIDIFVTHLATERHTLWHQKPPGFFTDRTASFGLNQSHWRGTGFGTVMADFDNDTDLDIAFVNGDIRASSEEPVTHESNLGPFWSKYAQRNQLFLNNGNAEFEDISKQNPSFCNNANVGRGLATGDLNNDGILDLVISSIGSPVRILYGKSDKINQWVTIFATDPQKGNRIDIGAEVTVISETNRWKKCLNPGGSYLCSNDPRLHFGLGELREFEEIEVRWTDGSIEQYPGRKSGSIIRIEKGSSRQK